MAQSCHVAFAFSQEHPIETKIWMEESNYIAILNCKNEEELIELMRSAKDLNIKLSVFKEPDLNNQITAIALEASNDSKLICKKLLSALKNL